MGVLYLYGCDGKVFSPSRFWDNVGYHSAGGQHGIQLSTMRLSALVVAILLTAAAGFYLLEGEVCQPEVKASWLRPAQAASCQRRVTMQDSLWFAFVSLTTIGYGDISPTNSYSRMWVSALAIASISVVSSLIDEVGGWRVALFHGRGGRPINQGVEWSACLLIILMIGLVLFTQFEGLSPSDSIYLSIITSTTIGYGDFKPVTQVGRALTCFFALASLSVFGYITSCVGDAIQPDSDTSIGFGGDEAKWGLSHIDRMLGRTCSDQESYSLSKNAPLKLWLFAKALLLVLASAEILRLLQPGLSVVDAVYLVVMTLTTVGYGDLTPLTTSAKFFHIFLAIAGLGLFSSFTDLMGGWRVRVAGEKASIRGCVLLLAVTMGAGAAAFAVAEQLAWYDSLYLAAMTGTTIGYGDLRPKSVAGKCVACVFACAGISAVGFVSTCIGDWVQDAFCADFPPPKSAASTPMAANDDHEWIKASRDMISWMSLGLSPPKSQTDPVKKEVRFAQGPPPGLSSPVRRAPRQF